MKASIHPSGTKQRRGTGEQAFTLIELVLSTALMTLVLGAAYACLQAALATRRTLEPRSDHFQGARVALALLTADLRSAAPLHKGPEFLGAPRQLGALRVGNLDFATHHFTPRRDGEGDYACISWYVENDPATGQAVLWRRRNPGLAPDPLSGGIREEILRPIEGLDLEFYDGFEWFENWGDPNGRARQQNSLRDRPNLVGMPKALRITLTLPAEPTSNPQSGAASNSTTVTFQTTVRLAIDTPSDSSTSGNSTTANPSPDAGPATPFPQ